MLLRKLIPAVALALGVALATPPAFSQTTEQQELAKNNPVAIVAQVQGDVQIKHVDADWRPMYWLDLLRPEDQIQTGDGAKAVALFFFDDHLEVVDPGSEAKVNFRNIAANTGKVRRHEPKGRSVAQIDIPYMLVRRLRVADFKQAEEEGAYQKEEIFLSGYVKNTTFPPVFFCKDMQLPKYRWQFFNEWDEFYDELTSKEPKLKYPYQPKKPLAKNGLYYWQVLAPDDTILVRKYPFKVLTQPLAELVARNEKRYAALKQKKQVTTIDTTDMFLLYTTMSLVDKNIHLLQEMIKQDPENPVLYRALVRAYLTRGCPAHAKEVLDKEIALGGHDPIEK